jgi:hypothetical protein
MPRRVDAPQSVWCVSCRALASNPPPQAQAVVACTAKREEAESLWRAAVVAENKLKRDVLALKDERKTLAARITQLEMQLVDARASLSAAHAGKPRSAPVLIFALFSTRVSDIAAALAGPPPVVVEHDATQTTPPPPTSAPRTPPPLSAPAPPLSPRSMLLEVFGMLSEAAHVNESPDSHEQQQQQEEDQHIMPELACPGTPPALTSAAAPEAASPTAKRRLCDEVRSTSYFRSFSFGRCVCLPFCIL